MLVRERKADDGVAVASLRRRRREFLLEVEPMPTTKKIELVEELTEKFSQSTITVATNYSGLPVNTMTELRQRMREKGVEYRVVKNTLAYLAADAAHKPQIKEIIQGPTALAFGYQEPAAVAKALEEYIRVNRSALTIRGAVLDERTLVAAEVLVLANLPPKNELVAQLAAQVRLPLVTLLGQLQAPMLRLVTVLNGPLASFTILLQQRAEQLKSQGQSS